MKEIYTKELLSLNKSRLGYAFENLKYPFLILPKIKDLILELGKSLNKEEFDEIYENVWVAKSANIFSNAYIAGPTIIDENAEIRCSAFIRGSAMIGKNAVVGNSCEIKNSILFDNVQTPHYNYVGDSILGYKAHMGAGSITSNVKADKTLVVIKNGENMLETKLKKFGAILADNVEVGCNAILNPGTVIGRNTNIYPLTSVRGYVKSYHILKDSKTSVPKK